jgi:hypothetical protein
MATFPLLKTGSVTQYPAYSATSESISIVRFMDGADQRWRSQGKSLRRWQVSLQLLSDDEIFAIESFFEEQAAEYTSFVFTDPLSGAAVPNCRIGDSSLMTEYEGPNSGTVSLWIVETNG